MIKARSAYHRAGQHIPAPVSLSRLPLTPGAVSHRPGHRNRDRWTPRPSSAQHTALPTPVKEKRLPLPVTDDAGETGGDPQVGERVVGNPPGSDHAVTLGVVSAVGRDKECARESPL